MNIAKYTTTAVILRSMIGNIKPKGYLYTIAFILVAFSIGWELYLVRDKQKKKKENYMNAGILMTISVIAIANTGGVYFYIKDHKKS